MTRTHFHGTSSAHQPNKNSREWWYQMNQGSADFNFIHRSQSAKVMQIWKIISLLSVIYQMQLGQDQRCCKAPPLFLQSPKSTMTRCGNIKLIQLHKANLTKFNLFNMHFSHNYWDFPNLSVHLTFNCLFLVYLFLCCMLPWSIKYKLL